jgi:predicted MFS family arabinose efflux permease
LFAFIARSYGEIPTSSLTNAKSSFRERFREGISFIRSKRILLQLLVVAVLVNFFGGAAQALLAPYVQSLPGGDSTTFGFTLAAFSLGVVLGSIGVGRVNAREHVGYMVFLGIAVIGAAFGLLGVVSIAAVAMLLVFLAGLGSAIVNLPLGTLIQVSVPAELMGRVFTSLSALATMSQPPASLIAGGIAGYTTVSGAFELFGVLILATTLVTWVLFKELRVAKY